MNREIKFRVKEKVSGEWVVGSLAPKGNEVSLPVFFANISTGRFDINTLGQYIGLPDKYGDEVYEGHICKNGREVGVIEWAEFSPCFSVDRRYPCNEGVDLEYIEFLTDWLEQATILGNTTEHPELLEKTVK